MARIVHVPGSTRKVAQLTGEFDRERGQPTRSRTESRFGLFGTDLGASVLHDGRVYFLFGDSVPVTPNAWHPRDGDAIAHTADMDPEQGITLDFVTAPDGHYLSPRVSGISLGAFEVPTGGFSARGLLYVFFTTDHSDEVVMGRSILTSTRDGGRSFRYIYDASVEKFINIAPVVVNNADWPGLPRSTGQGLLLWGSGPYRASDPYLAYVPLSSVERKSTWRYFAALGSKGQPGWSANEADAVPLVLHPVIGELSAGWNPYLRRWLLLYNGDNPRGITLRTAEQPWGPWSPGTVIFDPWPDGGYCHFIHTSWDFQMCDSVHDPGRELQWGGEYGPYLVAPYATGATGQSTIYYVMSTWNPYNTVLMASTLRTEPEGAPARVTGVPSMIQRRTSGTGTGDFELVAPLVGGGLGHYQRSNDLAGFPWHGPLVFGVSAGEFEAVSLIQSNFGSPGNLEIVGRSGDRLLFGWRDSAGWHGPVPLVADGVPVTGVSGVPSLIQGRYGTRGNFELVVPLAAGGLAHFWRNNDAPSLPWHGPFPFAAGDGQIEAVSLLQSNFGSPGNLEVAARLGDALVWYWRDDLGWHGPEPVVADGVPVAGVTGNPSVILNRFGGAGNFDMATPLRGGGIAHFWRDNDSADFAWHGPYAVDLSTPVEAVALIQSTFGDPGNLELAARVGEQLALAWRDSGPAYQWRGLFYLPPA